MKTHSVHVCKECGTTSPRWAGRCAGCGEWNTLEEGNAHRVARPVRAVAAPLRGVQTSEGTLRSSGIDELDRVLGGGFTPGSTTLLFGEPGVGKSTLALMALRQRALEGEAVLLIAAEESAAQVATRARRLGEIPPNLLLCATMNVEDAEDLIRSLKPVLCVVDSIAAMSDPSLPSLAGSVPQVRHGAERLCAAAKFVGASLVLVGHVTKDGELAGPRTLEHLVDTVLRIEGDRDGSLRILRALKHRFGATSEVGLLEMAGAGLRDLPEASLALPDDLEVSGVAMGVATDGSRSLLVEIQALVATGSGAARRVAHQLSSQRLSLLLAVLEVRCGIDTSTSDVLAASAGGLPALEPGVDVALALAIASAARGFAIAREVVCVGEVGLAGELRSVAGLSRRVREAQRLGARAVIVPVAGELDEVAGLRISRCRTLGEAIEVAQRHEVVKVR